MFKLSENVLSKTEMLQQMEESSSFCKLCLTRPAGFVYNQARQTCWCPRCGMPPVPQPEFMINNQKKGVL